MRILGISALYHDSAAAILEDGRVIAAAQEERFSRKKNDASFPNQAVDFCLRQAKLGSAAEVDLVGFYESTQLKFERILQTQLTVAPRGFETFRSSVLRWLRERTRITGSLRRDLDFDGEIAWCTHHEAHAASAFYPSPFTRAAVVSLDGAGEWATSAWGYGEGPSLSLRQELRFPHSLGLLYSAITYLLGFSVNRDEYKVMGLAPYGTPRLAQRFYEELIDLKSDGSFRLNMAYFDYQALLRMAGAKLEHYLGIPRRAPEAALTPAHMDLAASLQYVTEEVVRRVARHAVQSAGTRDLCLAGGVAQNSVANGRLLRDSVCDRLWVQPAAGDAGGALGAALYLWHQRLGQTRELRDGSDGQAGSLLGPRFEEAAVREYLCASKIPFEELGATDALLDRTAQLIESGSAVGWFQDRAEFGPRALGARSILADPREPDMRRRLNDRIKRRESFRPFAPAVLREAASDYFELEGDSDYMAIVAQVRSEHAAESGESPRSLDAVRSELPAVTHVDYSARVQTVRPDHNPRFHGLLSRFAERTGCPVLLNTSFNGRDEPIVQSPSDAYRCFTRTSLDYLVLDRFLIARPDQQAPAELGPDEDPGDFFTIYVLGGSTAAGEPYGPDLDLGKLVGFCLGGTRQGRAVRVVNLAHAAMDSDAVLEAARQVPASASLVLLYTGHNEYLRHQPSALGAPLDFIRGRGPAPAQTSGVGPLHHERAVRRLTRNLEASIEHLQRQGIGLVVATAAGNLTQWAPNRSRVAKRGSLRQVASLMTHARQRARAGDSHEAVQTARRILRVDPGVAWAHFLLARELAAQGRKREALPHFLAARDHDAAPTRCTSALNTAIRQVCARLSVPLADCAQLLEALDESGLFWDNCHPTLEGYLQLALCFREALSDGAAHQAAFRRPNIEDVRRAFALDSATQTAVLCSRVQYLFALALLQNWDSDGAQRQVEEYLRQAEALSPHDPEVRRARALAAALAGDVDSACANYEKLPRRIARGDLQQPQMQPALLRTTGAALFSRLGLQVPGVAARARTLVGVKAAPLRSRVSAWAAALAYYGLVVPTGACFRALEPNDPNRTPTSHWQPYTHLPEGFDREPGPQSKHYRRLIAFLQARRKPMLSALVAALIPAAAAMSPREQPRPYIYTLF